MVRYIHCSSSNVLNAISNFKIVVGSGLELGWGGGRAGKGGKGQLHAIGPVTREW